VTIPSSTPASVWKIDPSHTTIEFSAKHMMITTVKGRFTDLEGTVTVKGGEPEAAEVAVTMKAVSIDTRTDQRDQHLRSADFLDVEKYPDVTFTSTEINGTKDRFTMTGDLSIRGVTKPVSLDVTYEGTGRDPWGGERMGFSADGTIDRRDFGLMWNQALEAGGLLVSNTIKIHVDAQLVRV
jgi:polyisoprenoid-binding protein YceI